MPLENEDELARFHVESGGDGTSHHLLLWEVRAMFRQEVDPNTVYTVVSNLEICSEQSRWSRLNTFLVVESVILLAWASLFSSEREGVSGVLALLAAIGMLLAYAWSWLGYRSSKCHNAIHHAAMALECVYQLRYPNNEGPYHMVDEVRGALKRSPKWEKLAGTSLLVTFLPLMLSFLFSVLLGLSVRS